MKEESIIETLEEKFERCMSMYELNNDLSFVGYSESVELSDYDDSVYNPFNPDDEYFVDLMVDNAKIKEIKSKIINIKKVTKVLNKYDLEDYEELLNEYMIKWQIVKTAITYVGLDAKTSITLQIEMIDTLLILLESENTKSGVDITVKNLSGKKATLSYKELAKNMKDFLQKEYGKKYPTYVDMTFNEAKERLLSHQDDNWLIRNSQDPNLFNEFVATSLEDVNMIFQFYWEDCNYKKPEEISLAYLKRIHKDCVDFSNILLTKKGAKPQNPEMGYLAFKLSELYLGNKLDSKKNDKNHRYANSSYRFAYDYLCLWGIIKDIYGEENSENKTNYMKSIINQAKP